MAKDIKQLQEALNQVKPRYLTWDKLFTIVAENDNIDAEDLPIINAIFNNGKDAQNYLSANILKLTNLESNATAYKVVTLKEAYQRFAINDFIDI